MSAISTAWRCTRTPSWKRASRPVGAALRLMPLDREREDDHEAFDHVGNLLRESVSNERVGEEREQDSTADCAPDADAAAGERRPRYGDRRDRIELHPEAGVVRVGGVVRTHCDQSDETGEAGRDHVCGQL